MKYRRNELKKKDTPKLSVVVPVTNMAGRLENLTSWLHDITPHNIEVIIVHDFRDEQTGRELKEILEKHSDIDTFMVEGKYGSAGAARNAGLQHASGEWIAFWDSDDKPRVENVFSEVLLVENEGVDVIVGNFHFYSQRNGCFSYQHQNSILRLAMIPGIWRYVFRREFCDDLKFTSHRMGEDQLFLCNVFSLNPRLKFSNSFLYEYFVGLDFQTTASGVSQKEANETLESTLEMTSRIPKSAAEYHHVILINQLLTVFGSSKNFKQIVKSGSFFQQVSRELDRKLLILIIILEKCFLKMHWLQWKTATLKSKPKPF